MQYELPKGGLATTQEGVSGGQSGATAV